MKKVSCEVIQDLLPLYADDAANQETRKLVQEHLNTCPYCRNELRMMRSLISLPPDEDTGLVLQAFRERQAKQRRNKKIAAISALSAVVLLILFYVSFSLWYTRPRSWVELTGLIDEPDVVTGSYLTYDFMGADPGFVSWKLQETDGADPAAHQMLNELSAASYQASLRNLTSHIPPLRTIDTHRGIGHVSVFIRSQDHQTGITIDLYPNGEVSLLVTTLSSSTGFVTYDTDSSLYNALAGIIQKSGVLQED